MFGRRLSACMAMVAGISTACLSGGASATIWDITTVQSGSQGGFGFSMLHAASSSSHMSGATLATITGAGTIGQFNDVTGAMTATFGLTGSGIGAGSTMTVSTFITDTFTLIFDGSDGTLGDAALLNVVFNFIDGTPPSALVDTTIGFKQGYVCCGLSGDDPNSFHVKSDGSAVMSLWGANDFAIMDQSYDDPDFGMDLRLTLVGVIPEPMTGALFGIGLVGLGLVRRRCAK